MPLLSSLHTFAHRHGAVLCSVAFVLAWVAAHAIPMHAQITSTQDLRVVNQIPFEQVMSYSDVCGIENDPRNMNTFRVSDVVVPKNEQANITVSYGPGFTPQAREAFQRAIDVWRTHISTPVEIRIDASYQNQGANVLASAGPNIFYELRDTNGNSFIIGDALADALLESDQTPGEPDIIVNVNSGRDDWHFGAGNPGPAEIDFTSVILHEIGHGLNFIDLSDVESGRGSLGGEVNDEVVPGILSTGIVHEDPPGTFNPITNESIYPNPSSTLGDALTSNALFFTGENADVAAQTSTGPVPMQLYAPNTYRSGSSIAHFDESTYPPGDPNALMTPEVGFNEVARVPGPNMCGLLSDLGWTLNQGCLQAITPLRVDVRAEAGRANLSWIVPSSEGGRTVEEYVITTRRFGSEFRKKRRTAEEGTTEPIEDLPMGRYTFEVSWVFDNGTEGGRFLSQPVEINLSQVSATTRTDDITSQGRAPVVVAWQRPPDIADFQFEVLRAGGLAGEDSESSGYEPVSESPITGSQIELQNQAAGLYRYRIRATDNEGNVLLSESTEAEIPFDATVVFTEAYPNPTSGLFRFDVTAESAQTVDVEVYNTIGQRVYSTRVGLRGSVARTLTIDGSRWGSGAYFVRISGDDFTETRRVSLVR